MPSANPPRAGFWTAELGTSFRDPQLKNLDTIDWYGCQIVSAMEIMRKNIELPIHPDPCPALAIERGPTERGVGSWVPLEKHRLLGEYLKYTRHAWKDWPRRVFMDPFCGPGRIQVAGESHTRDGGALVAWRALAADAPFTHMLVGDLVADRADVCATRLKALGAAAKAFPGPAVETVPAMVAAVPTGSLCMAYIDPYNLELLSFSFIEALAKLKKVDLAINFCTMDLQRNVELEFDVARARFDHTAPGWRQRPAILSASKQNVKMEFLRYWCELVRGLGFEHSQEMPLIRNDSGHGIYRIVFFARHALPKRIWSGVAKGSNRNLSLFD
jgi:three-Cys-motif partner protein